MYTREEASAVKQKFWTSFGQYMAPVPSASLEKVNWVNYKTGIKGISFKMDAGKESAFVAVEIFLPNTMLQHQYFAIFTTFAKQFGDIAGNKWVMEGESLNNENQHICRIHVDLNGVNIFKQEDWPDIITFLKKNIMALDVFWQEYKPAFEML